MAILWQFFGNSLAIFWQFFGNSIGILWNFFWNSIGILWEFYRNSLGILEEFLRNYFGILWEFLDIWIWKELMFLSRFWGNAEDKKFRSLEVRGKPIALKNYINILLHYNSYADISSSSGSDMVIYLHCRYSFLLGFIMSKKF